MKRGLNRSAWWLLTLLPVDVLVVLDLERGEYRPVVWLARFMPALLVLAAVAWAHVARSAPALRLRKEFALTLPFGLPLMVLTGCSLVIDALAPTSFGAEMIRSLSAPLAGLLAIVTVLFPFVGELTNDTWASLRASPMGQRALLEKFGLAASLLVLASVQLAARPADELGSFAFASFAIALAFSLAAFRWVKHGLVAMFASMILAVIVSGAWALAADWPAPSYAVLFAGLALPGFSLATLPRWWRDLPLAEEQPGEHSRSARWLSRVAWPWRAELEPLRVVTWLPLLGVVTTLAFALDGQDGAVLPMFICCACGALLAPGIVFSEARRAGTLDQLLSMQRASTVFRRKAIAGGLFTLAVSVAAPTAVLGLVDSLRSHGALTWFERIEHASWPQMNGVAVLSWSLAMAFLFAVGLIVSLHSKHAAVALFIAGAAAAALAVAQFALAESSAALTHVLVHSGNPWDGLLDVRHLVATFVGTTLLLFGLAWWRFSDDRAPARKTLIGVGLCLAQAVAIAVVGPLLPAH